MSRHSNHDADPCGSWYPPDLPEELTEEEWMAWASWADFLPPVGEPDDQLQR